MRQRYSKDDAWSTQGINRQRYPAGRREVERLITFLKARA
jgi:hypothetical protein